MVPYTSTNIIRPDVLSSEEFARIIIIVWVEKKQGQPFFVVIRSVMANTFKQNNIALAMIWLVRVDRC